MDSAKIRAALRNGTLQVQAVSGTTPGWYTVSDVLRHQTGHKGAFKVVTETGRTVDATEDHSLFRFIDGHLEELAPRDMKVGDQIAVVDGDCVRGETVREVTRIDPLEGSFDLSVPGPQNFVLVNGIVAHNSYSIGGISLDINKADGYEASFRAMDELFDKQLEKAKQTVKILKGLQQHRYGMGVRSAFGPMTSKGSLTPRKFVGI